MLSFSQRQKIERAWKLGYMLAKTIGLQRQGLRHPGKAEWVVLFTWFLLHLCFIYYFTFVTLKYSLRTIMQTLRNTFFFFLKHYHYNSYTLQNIQSPNAANITDQTCSRTSGPSKDVQTHMDIQNNKKSYLSVALREIWLIFFKLFLLTVRCPLGECSSVHIYHHDC